MVIGIFAAALCALLQSFSYISSAAFMKRYNSSFKLMVYSQLAMGVVSVPLSIIFFPAGLFKDIPLLIGFMVLWVAVTCSGQFLFFATQKHIESSRLSSLLGLKIVVLAITTALFFGEKISLLQVLAIILATSGAVAINGGVSTRKVTLIAVLYLMGAILSYCFADLMETKLMKLSNSGNIWLNGLGVCATCYVLLGICMLPLLRKVGFSFEQLTYGSPYGVLYFSSQVALFVSFGAIGPVFANVIQSSRGIISVIIGIVLGRMGFAALDAKGDRRLWVRRMICAVIMTSAIIIYAISSR